MTRTIGESTFTGEVARAFKAVADRLALLERRMAELTGRRRDLEVIFHISGSVASGTYGPDWLPNGGTLYGVEARAQTAGSGSSTIAAKKSGSSVTGGTLTLAASATEAQLNVSTPATFTSADEITITVTPGSGLADLTVKLYFRVP